MEGRDPEFQLPPFDHDYAAENIRTYLSGDHILRNDDQIAVFEGFHTFFQSGETSGYVEAPTGGGKTVLFVELAKLLLRTPPNSPVPKILVVTSRKDLAHQIMGRDGKRGFGKFAPALKVNSYFSDSDVYDRMAFTKADIGVTLYDSFNLIRRRHDSISLEEADEAMLSEHRKTIFESYFDGTNHQQAQRLMERDIREGRPIIENQTILSKFDLFIFDEAHRLFEGQNRNAFWSLPNDAIKLGFTGTADADDVRRLKYYFPHTIFSKKLAQGIESNMVAPLMPVGIKSGIRIEGDSLYNEQGEFSPNRLLYLARDEERNRRIVTCAVALTRLGMRGIIGCVPGDEMWHAKHIADLLRKEGISSLAIHSGVGSSSRRKTYEAFEYQPDGPQVLSYIDILEEGWDSNRAKFGIFARPTRSLLKAQQRIGRLTRPGGLAVAIDIVDDYTSGNMSVNAADVLDRGNVALGVALGTLSAEDEILRSAVVEELGGVLPLLPILYPNYRSWRDMLSRLPSVERGQRVTLDGKQYTMPHLVNNRYRGVDEALLVRAGAQHGIEPRTVEVNDNGALRIMYNIDDCRSILSALPDVPVDRLYVDTQRVKWITPSGIIKLFSKRYPDLGVTELNNVLASIKDRTKWQVGKIPYGSSAMHYQVVAIYAYTPTLVDTVNRTLYQHYNS